MNYQSLLKEAVFKAVRSSGKGGQHVNKVSSKAVLEFDVFNSGLLTEQQKQIISEKLKSKISARGILQLSCDSERSQYSNRLLVSDKFLRLISKALERKRKRIKSMPTSESKEERLRVKKEISALKKQRKKIKGD